MPLLLRWIADPAQECAGSVTVQMIYSVHNKQQVCKDLDSPGWKGKNHEREYESYERKRTERNYRRCRLGA